MKREDGWFLGCLLHPHMPTYLLALGVAYLRVSSLPSRPSSQKNLARSARIPLVLCRRK